MSTQTFTVTGMTCEHCVKSVTEELSELAGVTDVQVQLDSGAVTVTSAEPLSHEDATEAVQEAGYAISEWPATN